MNLFARDCVTCSSTPKCPSCDDDEECVLTTQTCSTCPKTYCSKVSSSLSSTDSSLTTSKIGGIAGGSAAFALIVVMCLGWWLLRRRRQKALASGELYKEGASQRRLSGSSFATTTNNSILTRASNILNVAYIPGVKVRAATGTRNTPAASVYSKETYMSDLENASFHAGEVASKGTHAQLVNIDEEAYDYENGPSHEAPMINLAQIKLPGSRLTRVMEEDEEDEAESIKKKPGMFGPLVLKHSAEPLASDSDEDSEDSDSDEENIELLVRTADPKNSAGSTVMTPINLTPTTPTMARSLLSTPLGTPRSRKAANTVASTSATASNSATSTSNSASSNSASTGSTGSTATSSLHHPDDSEIVLSVEFEPENPFSSPFDDTAALN